VIPPLLHADLHALRLHWDEAYLITYHPDDRFEPWHAERLDDHDTLKAGSAATLRDSIISDYSARPVPRAQRDDDDSR
jgi:hypothetical protein